jgi:NAD+ synthase (glutamine-hydrolysing)
VASALREILARPVSPELVPPNADDSLRQITEDAVGPYELVDFFLWHFVFLKEKPSEILDLAEQVFNDTYTRGQLKHWLTSFIRRFFNSQFKRKATPDGVACFPWQLVPISTWYMPSDASSRLWLDDLLDDLGENHDLS